MIRTESIRIIFQPVLELQTGRLVGHESLGRGCLRSLSTRPAELFRLASMCGLAGELSRLFRRAAVRESSQLSAGDYVFCNLHPDELAKGVPTTTEQFLPELPIGRTLVLEIPETLDADAATLCNLRDRFHKCGVQLAFDDFGIGQSRLGALADARPDFIKLDIDLVRDLDRKHNHRTVVQSICEMAQKLGITVIAEGLERPEELEACKKLGCGLGQGFLLGHPEYIGSCQTVLN
jgi:EAL domain-containing protein (putative c-di-GMP-specific phosphodiesterase class I)